MASIITATTTSGLTHSADNSGVLQLASGTGNLVTVPSATGTMALTSTISLQVAEQWALTADFTNSAGADTEITTNLAINTATGYGSLNQGMTQSSGVFTFPSTGYWLVSFNAAMNSSTTTSRYAFGRIKVTTNNSTYTNAAQATGALTAYSGTTWVGVNTQQIINVSSTTNVKVKFSIESQNAISVRGDGTTGSTFMTFIKLG
jgi:hypothetical protein